MSVKTMYKGKEISGVDNNVVVLTHDEYNALPDTKLNDGKIYVIKDGTSFQNMVEYVTPEEYKALGDAVLTDNKIYFVREGQAKAIQAGSVNYVNSASTLESTNVNSAITELDNKFERVNKIDLTPTLSGVTNYEPYDNCYYEKYGHLCHVHIGVQGLTPAENNLILKLPDEVAPRGRLVSVGVGQGSNIRVVVSIYRNGEVTVYPDSFTYAICDIIYLI